MQALGNLLFLTLVVFTGSHSYAQYSETDTINSIVRLMAANDIYERSYTVGFTGAYSQQLELFEKLKLIASERELTKLALYNNNAVVRLYAFQALKQKITTIPEAVHKQFENDNTEVITLTGCAGDIKLVRSLAFTLIIQHDNSFSR